MSRQPKYQFPVSKDVAAQQRAQQDEVLRLRTALEAIMARLEGNFDHPALVALGPLSTTTADIGTLASEALGAQR